MYIMKVIHGNVILDEFMTALLSAGGSLSCLLTFRLGPKQQFSGETYQSQLSVEKAEEQERTERNWVKDEQEKAFQARWNTQR